MAKTVFGMPALGKKTKDDDNTEKEPDKAASSTSAYAPFASPKSGPGKSDPGAVPMAAPVSTSASKPAEKRVPADANRTMFGMPAMKLPSQAPPKASEPSSPPDEPDEPHREESRAPEKVEPMYAETQEVQAGPRGAAVGVGGGRPKKAAFKATVVGMAAPKPEDTDASDTGPAAEPAADAPESLPGPNGPAATVILNEMPQDKTEASVSETSDRSPSPVAGESWTDAGIEASAAKINAGAGTAASASFSHKKKSKKKFPTLLVVLTILAAAAAVAVAVLLIPRLLNKNAPPNAVPAAIPSVGAQQGAVQSKPRTLQTPAGGATAQQQQSPAPAQ